MKDSLKPGVQKSRRIRVDAARATRHMGEHLGVYATPAMIMDFEMLCRDLLLEHLDAGEDSVGTRVDVEHLAATPEGLEVELKAAITGVDRKAVTFEVSAHDGHDEIGRGRHYRFVVEVAKLKDRLQAKIAKTRGG